MRLKYIKLVPIMVLILLWSSEAWSASWTSNSTARKRYPVLVAVQGNEMGTGLKANYHFSSYLAVGALIHYNSKSNDEINSSDFLNFLNFEIFPVKSMGWFIELNLGNASQTKWEAKYCLPSNTNLCGTTTYKFKDTAYMIQTGFRFTNYSSKATGGIGIGVMNYGSVIKSVDAAKNTTGLSESQLIQATDDDVINDDLKAVGGTYPLVNVYVGYSF